jgi:hypothetical protein
MPNIYTAFASEAKINEETLEGLQAIEYRAVKSRHDVGAIGTDERIAVYFGMKLVSGTLRVASAAPTLDGLLANNTAFSLAVTLRHGDTARTVAFDEVYLDEKRFALDTEAHGETVYTFSATRVREQ